MKLMVASPVHCRHCNLRSQADSLLRYIRIRNIRLCSSLALLLLLQSLASPISALPPSAIKDFFDLFDEDGDGMVTRLEIDRAKPRQNINPIDFSLVEELFTDADLESGKLEQTATTKQDEIVSFEEFEREINKLDADGANLANVQSDDSSTRSSFVRYLRDLERVLQNHGDRPRCDAGYFRAGAWCYIIMGRGATQSYAESDCREIDAKLPVFDSVNEFEQMEAALTARGDASEASGMWLSLKKYDGQNWEWLPGSKLQDARWRSGEPNGASEIGSGGESASCAIAYFNRGTMKPGWADDACEAKNIDVMTVCQTRPQSVDIFISYLNQNLTDKDLVWNEYDLGFATVNAGKTQEEIQDLNRQLRDLNKNYAAREDSNYVKADDVEASVVHDTFPMLECLKNRVRNTACVPAAGKRRKRGKCSDKRRKRKKRATFSKDKVGWEQMPTIKYLFDSNLENHESTKQAALDAIEFWKSNTCVEFEDTKDKKEIPHVIVVRKKGCWSSIGRDSSQKQLDVVSGDPDNKDEENPQVLSLGEGCDKFYIAAHEFGHLLGLEHEQARNDRSWYVTVNAANVDPKFLFNFDVCDECCRSDHEYPYDFGSIMHYTTTEFGLTDKEGNPYETIVDTTPDRRYKRTMGNVWFPSFYDVWQINDLLCSESCGDDRAVCQNGGYAHPRECSKCICPAGFGGDACDSFEPAYGDHVSSGNECGGIIDVSSGERQIETAGYSQNKYFRKQQCSWIIQAPPDKVVHIRFDPNFGLSRDCRFGHVMVKYRKDVAVSGVQHCGTNAPAPMTSAGSRMLVLLRIHSDNESNMRGFRAFVSAVTPNSAVP